MSFERPDKLDNIFSKIVVALANVLSSQYVTSPEKWERQRDQYREAFKIYLEQKNTDWSKAMLELVHAGQQRRVLTTELISHDDYNSVAENIYIQLADGTTSPIGMYRFAERKQAKSKIEAKAMTRLD